jgi:hypothetical protein
MSTHVCCGPKAAAARCASGGVASTALLLLMPKCPMCVAAYIALVTGVGVSVSTAAYLREGMLVLSAVALAYVTTRCFRFSAHAYSVRRAWMGSMDAARRAGR